MNSQSWATLSNQFIYAAMFVYTLVMIALAYDLAFAGRKGRAEVPAVDVLVGAAGSAPEDQLIDEPVEGAPAGQRTRFGNIGFSLLVLGFGLQAVGVVLRGIAAGRVPWGNMYEFSITASLSVVGIYLLLNRRFDLRWMGIFIVTPVLLALGLAVTVLYVDAGQLVPALRSYWLVIHVSAAVISFGLFTTSAVISILYLVDTLGYRIVAFVFPLWTFAVIAGAIWAENAWGRYWGWDPKETWAFITWVVYAGYLHARVTVGWKGRKTAVIALVGYASLIFNFVGVNIWLPGLHSYSGL
ncbi:MAG: cytochrome c biogenesis protein CcsA [Actinobacteria bacterium]|nr:cytochrome c biogenesis protein CcsA [Actinomycetota bacterium]